jgi:hypothetical protein
VTRIRPELLQWYGLFGAALAWTGQLIVGFGVAYADCAAASSRWGLDVVTWQIALMVVGLSFAGLAELAAIRTLLTTSQFEHDDPPPEGRRHFFAFAAALGNVLFMTAILLNGIGALSNVTCRPA